MKNQCSTLLAFTQSYPMAQLRLHGKTRLMCGFTLSASKTCHSQPQISTYCSQAREQHLGLCFPRN